MSGVGCAAEPYVNPSSSGPLISREPGQPRQTSLPLSELPSLRPRSTSAAQSSAPLHSPPEPGSLLATHPPNVWSTHHSVAPQCTSPHYDCIYLCVCQQPDLNHALFCVTTISAPCRSFRSHTDSCDDVWGLHCIHRGCAACCIDCCSPQYCSSTPVCPH